MNNLYESFSFRSWINEARERCLLTEYEKYKAVMGYIVSRYFFSDLKIFCQSFQATGSIKILHRRKRVE